MVHGVWEKFTCKNLPTLQQTVVRGVWSKDGGWGAGVK